MPVLCCVMFSFLYLVMFMCLVLRQRIAVQFFFVFVNFSNVHVCFVFHYVQFFVFPNLNNVHQVLVVYLNLRVYLIVFVFIGWVFILWYFELQFFVIFNFSNVLSVYLNLRVYLFVLVFVTEALFRLAVFSGNLLAGDVHSSVTMDKHAQDRQHLPTHLRPTLVICLFTWALRWCSGFPTTLILGKHEQSV